MFCGRFRLPSIVEIVTYHHNHECELCIRKVEHWNQYRNTIGDDENFLTLDFKGNAMNGTSTKKATSMSFDLLNITNQTSSKLSPIHTIERRLLCML
ncbi:hypothetical protein BDL97_03G056700 [Sphagnum fallax]|nr:hypothetical protein BDL97_03G056700 [Sphagnum fallax]